MKIVSWNVHYWTEQCGKDGGRQRPQFKKICARILEEEADVICLQEAVLGEARHLYGWGGYTGKRNAKIIDDDSFPGPFAGDYHLNFAKASDLYSTSKKDKILGCETGFGNAVLLHKKFRKGKEKTLLLNGGVKTSLLEEVAEVSPDALEGRSAAITTFKSDDGISYAVASTHLDVFDGTWKLRVAQVRYLAKHMCQEYPESVCIICMDANMDGIILRSVLDPKTWEVLMTGEDTVDHIYVHRPGGSKDDTIRLQVDDSGYMAEMDSKQQKRFFKLSDHPLLSISFRTHRACALRENVVVASVADPDLFLGHDKAGKVRLAAKRHPWTVCTTHGTFESPDRSRCLDVYDPAGVVHGEPVRAVMYRCNRHENQGFLLKPAGKTDDGDDGTVVIMPACKDSVALDIYDPVEPQLMYYRLSPGSENQRWTLEEGKKSKDNKNKSKSKNKNTNKATSKGTSKGPSKTKTKTKKKNNAGTKAPTAVPPTNGVLRSRMHALRGVYHAGFEFPEWSIDAVLEDQGTLLKGVVCYYDACDDLAEVKKLVHQREPVNIGMHRHYDTKALKDLFGWSRGYYEHAYDKGLPPNIAVYTPTIIDDDPGRRVVHIIHLVGYAFDVAGQPDAEYFRGPQELQLLRERYREVFAKALRCARDHALHTIVFSLVGANNFAAKYRDAEGAGPAHFQRKVWVPAFEESLARDEDDHSGTLRVLFMGTAGSTVAALLPDVEDIGFFPGCVERVDRSRTLFVNAWDPWSLPGNGNGEDNSLDGYVGRCTAVAVAGSTMTNPYIKFRACE